MVSPFSRARPCLTHPVFRFCCHYDFLSIFSKQTFSGLDAPRAPATRPTGQRFPCRRAASVPAPYRWNALSPHGERTPLHPEPVPSSGRFVFPEKKRPFLNTLAKAKAPLGNGKACPHHDQSPGPLFRFACRHASGQGKRPAGSATTTSAIQYAFLFCRARSLIRPGDRFSP